MSDIFELAVVIKAVDFFTGPLRSMVSQVTAADTKFKAISNTMKMMGKSKAEIDAINSSLNKMADQKAFANIANDLQKIGMAKEDIAAMESSYMRMSQYQRDMAAAQKKYAAGKDLAMSGVGDLTTAAVGGFGIMEMVKQAGEFQSNMTVIQQATGATTKQMNDLGNAVMNTSAKVSKFNDFQTAQIAQTLASGGFGNVSDVQKLLLPTAKFTEVQMYENKASDPVEITKQVAEMAHVMKMYDPKQFESFLNTFNKFSMMQPGDSSQLAQTLTYLAPSAETLKMKPQDIMSLSALANVIGLQGTHGGTNAADMILRMIPGYVGGKPTPIKNSKGQITGYKTPNAWAAMQDLGLINAQGQSKFFNKDGSLKDLNGLLGTLIADGKGKKPSQLLSDYVKIFGQQGGRAAAQLSNPQALEQLQKMQAQLKKTSGTNMETTNAALQANPEGQLNLLKSNSMTLMLRVGQQLAISLNPAIKSINDFLGKLLSFSQAHPGVAKIIGDFALLAVGGKAVEGVFKIIAGNVKMVSAAFKMFKITSEAGELTKFGRILKGLKGTFAFVADGIKLFGSTTLTILKDFGSGILSLGKTIAKWAIETAGEWLIAMGPVGWIIAGVTAIIAAGIIMWNTNFLGFRDMLKGVWKVVQTDAGKAWDWIKTTAGKVVDWFKNLPNQMMQIGQNIMQGLINGVTGMIGKVTSTVKSIAGGVVSTFKNLLGIHSPSTVFAEHGKWIVAGLAQGIDGNAYVANQSTSRLANGLSGSFRPNIQTANGSVGGGSGEINIHPGAIVINGGNASAQEIAQLVLVKLGQASRQNLMNTGFSLNIGAF